MPGTRQYIRRVTLISTILVLSCLCIAYAQGKADKQQKESYPWMYFNYQKDTAEINKLITVSQRSPFDSGVALLKAAFERSILTGYYDGAAQSSLGLGVMYAHSGNYEKSIDYYKQAYSYCYHCHEKQYRVLLWEDMASSYARLDNRAIGLFCLYRALDEIQKNDLQSNHTLTADVYTNIGATLLSDDQNKKGLYYLKKAEALTLAKGIYIPLLYLNMASVYHDSNTDSSLYYAQKELALSKAHHLNEVAMVSFFTIGDAYIDKKIPQMGIRYLDSGIRYITNNINPLHKIQYYARMGEATYALKDYPRAQYYLNTALQLSNNLHVNDGVSFYTDTTLAAVYAHQNNYKAAYNMQRIYINEHETYLKKQKDSLINQLEIKYRTAEKDKEIITQQTHIRQKNIWIGVISMITALLALLMIGMLLIYKHKKQLQEGRIRNLEQEREISELRAILKGEEKERKRLARELHDGIMGQLSAVKLSLSFLKKKYNALTDAEDFNEALQNLDEAARDLRYTAHNLMPTTLAYGGLTEALRLFCDKVSRASDLKIHFHAPEHIPELNSDFELSIYRIIQELAQNIIKHAHASEALVQVDFYDTIFSVTIEDNGIGIDKDKLNEPSNAGLNGIRDRINTMHGKFLLNNREGGGTVVEIELDTSLLKNKERYVYKGSDNG